MLDQVQRSLTILSALAIVLAPTSALAGDGEPDVAESAAPPIDSPRVAVGAGGHVAFGTTPSPAVGARVSGELATRVWSVGLEGRYESSVRSTRTSAGVATPTTLAGVSLVPCLRATRAWACGVVLASHVSSEGEEVSAARLLLSAGVRFVMHVSLPFDSALRITGELLAQPMGYELVANGHRVFRSSILSTMLGPSLVHAF